MIDLPELVRRHDPNGPHEVRHVEPIGAASARALLARKPDFFLGDRGELVESGEGLHRPSTARYSARIASGGRRQDIRRQRVFDPRLYGGGVHGPYLPGWGRVGGVGHAGTVSHSERVINWIITC